MHKIGLKMNKDLDQPINLEEDEKLTEDLFKSIVLDRDQNAFKIIKGDFKDKKDLIDTYDKDYKVKRVFEKDVFDWIEKNAKNSIDAYLLYSMAYRKWRDNNLLYPYYQKLVKDLPRLKSKEILDLRDPRTESVKDSEIKLSKIQKVILDVLKEENIKNKDN